MNGSTQENLVPKTELCFVMECFAGLPTLNNIKISELLN